MLFKKNTPEAVQTEPIAAEAASAETENPFLEAAETLIGMQQDGTMPEGFDLEAACSDPTFASLLQEFEPNAAVRIYAAEGKAAQAYTDAMQAMTDKLNARNALPKSTRPTRAIAPTPDYMSLSPEAFRALEAQLKSAARSGRRMTL